MGRVGGWIVGIAVLVIMGSFLAPVAYLVGLAGRGHAVDRELARIKASGEPATAEDLAGKHIPDSENAATLYEKCFGNFPRRSGFQGGGMLWGSMRPRGSVNDATYWDRARSMVARYSDVIPMAEKAAAMPRCKFRSHRRTFFGMSNHLVRIRMLSRLVSLQALLDAKDGNTDAAVRHIGLLFKISDSLKDECSIPGQRLRCMCFVSASDALARSAALISISESQARALADLTRQFDLRDCARTALLGERVDGIGVYAGVWSSRHTLDDEGHIGAFKRLGNSLPGRTWLYTDELYYLGQMRQQVESASTPYRLLKPQHLHSATEAPRYPLFSTMLVPSGEEVLRTVDGGKASLAGSQIFLGLIAYHDRFGSYPASLAALETRLGWLVPEDPFSGKQFIYHRQGRGFVLYSIGDDLKDDGGTELDRMGTGDMVWKLDK